MTTQKSLLVDLAETIARHRSQQPASKTPGWLRWLGRQLFPNLGSVLLVLILFSTFPGLAASLNNVNATSLSTIPYQGRLADASGNPITDRQNMEFRLYDVPTGGTPLWTEFWTGGNSVNVSDGLFSVMLGSINTQTPLASVVQGNDQLYLGITVGTDTEMAPRVQLGSVPFSMISLTVPDGSVTTDKIADNSVTNAKIADGAVTDSKLARPVNNIVLSRVTLYDSYGTTNDGQWHDLDISSLIPSTAKAVIVHIGGSGAGSSLHVAPGGQHEGDYLSLGLSSDSGSQWTFNQGIVKVIGNTISYCSTNARFWIVMIGYIE